MPFSEGKSYSQESGPGTSYKTLVAREEGRGLNMGYVVQEGATYTLSGRHDWPQWYLVIQGQGVIAINDEEYAVTAPTLITLPPKTKHSTRVEEGQRMEYIYINQFSENGIYE